MKLTLVIIIFFRNAAKMLAHEHADIRAIERSEKVGDTHRAGRHSRYICRQSDFGLFTDDSGNLSPFAWELFIRTIMVH